MITSERVEAVMRQKGPTIPNEIRMALGEGDTFTIGAVLSEMTSKGKVKITSVKKGGSPYYYLVGQEHLLERVSSSLNEKDLRAMQLLKGRKILYDKDLDPLMRVALRQIKDFSKTIEVNHQGEQKLFFKYYLTPASEAENMIKEFLGIKKPVEPVVEKIPLEVVIEKPKIAEKIIEPPKIINREIQEKIIEKPTGEFEEEIHSYFKKKGISILEKDIIRRQTEIDFIIKIPSPAGDLTYYCKARNKQKLNDKDLSAAYVESQEKKLPVLFLITGELTKKATEMLQTKFRSITVNQL